VGDLGRLVTTLRQVAGDPESRGPLVGLVDASGVVDLRSPPTELACSPHAFLHVLAIGIREAAALGAGVVLPVRTVWGEDRVCDYLDAEALVLVAVRDYGNGVGSVGQRCPLHELPAGWVEAHESLQWLARPLRRAVAGRPIAEDETPSR
jgi:hypothetical protein